MKISRTWPVGMLGLCVCLAVPASALAAPVTVETQARVVFVDTGDFSIGELVNVSYTFESTNPDLEPTVGVGFYSGPSELIADFPSSGRSFTFGENPVAGGNFISLQNDFTEDGIEFIDILSMLSSVPLQVDTVGGASPATLQVAFTDFRTNALPTMLTDDSVPVAPFPFSFVVVSFLAADFSALGSVIIALTPDFPNPDNLPIGESTTPNANGEFEILDEGQNVVGSSTGDLARAAGVAAESGGNQFFTFKNMAGTPGNSDFFMLGKIRIADDLAGPADLRGLTISAKLRMVKDSPSASLSASGPNAGTDDPMVQFVLTDENGDQVATRKRNYRTSGFQTERATESDFDQPVDGTTDIDMGRITEVSFGFSSTGPVPEMEFDADDVVVPEPDAGLLQAAAALTLAVLSSRARWRSRRIAGPGVG